MDGRFYKQWLLPSLCQTWRCKDSSDPSSLCKLIRKASLERQLRHAYKLHTYLHAKILNLWSTPVADCLHDTLKMLSPWQQVKSAEQGRYSIFSAPLAIEQYTQALSLCLLKCLEYTFDELDQLASITFSKSKSALFVCVACRLESLQKRQLHVSYFYPSLSSHGQRILSKPTDIKSRHLQHSIKQPKPMEQANNCMKFSHDFMGESYKK